MFDLQTFQKNFFFWKVSKENIYVFEIQQNI